MSDPVGRYLQKYGPKQDDPVERYLARYGAPMNEVTEGQKSVAKELFAGASALREDQPLKEPTARDVIGLNDPVGKLKQLAASVPELAVMGARDVAGSLAGLAAQPHEGVGGEIPAKPADPMAGLRKGQAVRERFEPALSEIDELAGGQPKDMLGMAARIAGPLPLAGAGRSISRALAARTAKREGEAVARRALSVREQRMTAPPEPPQPVVSDLEVPPPETPKVETDPIVAAAIRDPESDRIFRGQIHADAYWDAVKSGMDQDDVALILAGDPANVGFVTKSGRFLTRNESDAGYRVRDAVNADLPAEPVAEAPKPTLKTAPPIPRRPVERTPVTMAEIAEPEAVKKARPKKIDKMTDDELLARRHQIIDRIDASQATAGENITQFSRERDWGGKVVGTSVNAKAGRALGRLKDDGRIIGEIDQELAKRGFSEDDLWERYLKHSDDAERAAIEGEEATGAAFTAWNEMGKAKRQTVAGLAGAGIGGATGAVVDKENPLRGAALGAIGGAGLAGGPFTKALRNRQGKIQAFHGSPHQFDKFSMEKVGTGEGAQAYGHGLYFTDKKEIAEHYRRNLSGERWRDIQDRITADESGYHAVGPKGKVRTFSSEKEAQEWASEGLGATYKVDLDVEPDDLLDWDKPLSEQPPKVQAALRPLLAEAKTLIDDSRKFFGRGMPEGLEMPTTGEQLYRLATRTSEGKEEASRMLREAGIKGIRYLDGSSRGRSWTIQEFKGKFIPESQQTGNTGPHFDTRADAEGWIARQKDLGTYNYVIFDDAAVNIAERGSAGTKTLGALALGGTGAALSQSENPELAATGKGILALTVLHGIGSRRMGKMGKRLVRPMTESPAGRAILDKINPDALLTPEVRQAIKQYELDVAKSSARAKELGGKARALGPAADRKVSDVIEGESFESTRLSPQETEKVLAVAAEIGEEFTKQGRAKVSAGLLPEQAVTKREGKYLPRKYAYHEAQDAQSNLPSGTSQGKIRVGPEHRRKDLAPDIREMLGEIREASYRTEQGLTKGGKDLAAQRLFETLRGTDAMHPLYAQAADALKAAKLANDAPKIIEAEQALKALGRSAGGDWVTLPDTRGLGPLRGAVVRKEVANEISGLPDRKGVAGKLLTYWKKSHTVYNPGTHLGNFFSNVSLAHLAGLNVWEMPTALRAAQIELRRYGPAAKALTEAGVLDVNIATHTAEGAAQLGKRSKVQLRELAGTTKGSTKDVFEAQGVKPLGPIERALRKTDKKVSGLYNNEDNVFRVALYRKMTKQGMDPKEAAEYTRENLINFRTRSPLLNWVRNTGLSPFVLFPAKALPLVARQIVDHPWRWVTLAATWGAVDQYSQRRVGRIADQDLSDRDQRSKLGYLLPGATQLPFKGSEGEKYAFDISRFTPLSAVTTGGVPGSTGSALSGNIPQALQPSGPLVDILARAALNTDPFTGDKFIRPSDNARDIAQKATFGKVGPGTFTPGALAGLALPSVLSYQIPRVMSDLANDDTKAAKVDAFGIAGLRPRVIRPGHEEAIRQYKQRREIEDIQAEMRRDLRKAKSKEARIAVFERARKKRTAVLERMQRQPEMADR